MWVIALPNWLPPRLYLVYKPGGFAYAVCAFGEEHPKERPILFEPHSRVAAFGVGVRDAVGAAENRRDGNKTPKRVFFFVYQHEGRAAAVEAVAETDLAHTGFRVKVRTRCALQSASFAVML